MSAHDSTRRHHRSPRCVSTRRRRFSRLGLGRARVQHRRGHSVAHAIGGDYYGTVAIIASRSARYAEPHTIVATATVANGAHASAQFKPIGAREPRGISEPVELFQLL